MKSPLASALIVFVLLGLATYAIFFIAPVERTMHEIQKIFYLHVTSAWTAFVAFFIVFVASIAYLAKRTVKWDALALSAAEVGLVFCSVMLITGPIWAKPVWGIWWTWDARLTSAFVLWLMYVAYLLLRSLIDDPARRAVVSAVFGIFAFLDVPLVYFSIRIWRTQHPQPVIMGGEGSGLDPVMRQVLYFTWLPMLLLMGLLIRQRRRLEALRHEISELEMGESAVPVSVAPRPTRSGSASAQV
ncbi:MAG: cytochrome c biogenesis protein CcsA [Acidobacteria bacterium]|nr:cytochrome c biogenesis protein CcsA [Acidobacteriota bacterium]